VPLPIRSVALRSLLRPLAARGMKIIIGNEADANVPD
jgi:hypothetical protein